MDLKISVRLIVWVIMIGILGCLNTNTADSENEKFDGLTDLYIFIDVTDRLYEDFSEYEDDIPKIMDKIGLDAEDGGVAGANIQFFLLNETSSSPVGEVQIPKASNDFTSEDSNIFNRIDDIEEFKYNLNTTWKDIITSVNWQKDNSKLYQQLCRELNRMTKFSKADQQVFIVYSDMLEHSNLFSFYGSRIKRIEKWLENKDRLDLAYQRELSTDCRLPTIDDGISNVELYFVAKRTQENDEKINIAEKFWSHLFKEQGIKKVHFGSDLIFRD